MYSKTESPFKNNKLFSIYSNYINLQLGIFMISRMALQLFSYRKKNMVLSTPNMYFIL